MLKHRFYYTLKPFLPWSVRMAARRISARRILTRCKDVWPIYPTSGNAPSGWPGWPEGKKFAVVLTHDVESADGVAKCRQLMQLEQQLGFRSAFNFIPEGPYQVPAELRQDLTRNGFEVGVHDLKHDGTLFRSERRFRKSAVRINRYLEEWDAAGFRSGFMLRNLDWLHALNIQYDCSTFDTDPFEFQPEGTGTIFPFWVPAPAQHSNPATSEALIAEPLESNRRVVAAGSPPPNGSKTPLLPSPFSLLPERASRASLLPAPCSLRPPNSDHPSDRLPPTPPVKGPRRGYVELPYTLPQDSTVFFVLGETAPEVWLRKTDWIVAHGGMVLLNVHPDYIRFEGDAASARTYDYRHYSRFLEYLRNRYAGEFWHPLPREVAAFVRQIAPAPVVHLPRRICMVTHSHYECDNRVTRYAESLAERGDQVDVFALRSSPAMPRQTRINGVNVHRIQDRFVKTQRTRLAYLWPHLRFLVKASLAINREHVRNPYDLVHVHNMPDFLVLSAWYPKLTGARVILDIHDIVPEFYRNKFGSERDGGAYALLKIIERQSARFADHVIISNHLWRDMFASRTGTNGRCSVFINNVDTQTFHPSLRNRKDGRVIILFPGGLQWHQGVDIAIRAFSRIADALPEAEFHIYGDGIMKGTLVALTLELGLTKRIRFFPPVPIAQIATIMANADLGVVPKRADSFGNEAYSTKIMEFMAVGVPVVASRTRIDQYYFDDSLLRFFDSGDDDAMAEAMLDVLWNRELRENLIAKALCYARRNSWQYRKTTYLDLMDGLTSKQQSLPYVSSVKPPTSTNGETNAGDKALNPVTSERATVMRTELNIN